MEYEDIQDELLEGLRSSATTMRAVALEGMSQISVPEAFPILLELREEAIGVPDIMRNYYRALGHCGRDKALPVLRESAKKYRQIVDSDASKVEQDIALNNISGILQGLNATGEPDALGIMGELFRGASPRIQMQVAFSLGRSGLPAAYTLLEDLKTATEDKGVLSTIFSAQNHIKAREGQTGKSQ
jgi:HEAT repeat protein